MADLTINLRLSRTLGQETQSGMAGYWRAALNVLQTMGSDADAYVEGWVVSDRGLVFEHAWLEMDGEIVDPTLYEHPARHYVAGPRWPYAEAIALLRTETMTFPAVNALQFKAPSLYRLYYAAYDRAVELSQETRHTYQAGADDLSQVQQWAARKQAAAQAEVPTLARIQRLCDRAASRVQANNLEVDIVRTQASWDQSDSWLLLDVSITSHRLDKTQTYSLPVSRQVLTYAEEELVLTIRDVIEQCVERFFGRR